MRSTVVALALLASTLAAPAQEATPRAPLFQRTADSVLLAFNRSFSTDDDGQVDMRLAKDFRYTCHYIFSDNQPAGGPQRFCESLTADNGAVVAVRDQAGNLRALSLVLDPVLLGEQQQQTYLYNMLMLYLRDQVPPENLRQTAMDATNHILRTINSGKTYEGQFATARLRGYFADRRIHLDLNRL